MNKKVKELNLHDTKIACFMQNELHVFTGIFFLLRLLVVDMPGLASCGGEFNNHTALD